MTAGPARAINAEATAKAVSGVKLASWAIGRSSWKLCSAEVQPGPSTGAFKMGEFMKHIGLLLAAGVTLSVAAPAAAQTASGGVDVGVTGGTLGIGPEVGYRANGFGVRANATFLGVGRNVSSDGVDYDGKLKLRSFGAMVDFYPFGGGFRISPGARITRNRVQLTATPTEDVEIGDDTYMPSEIGTIRGEVRAKRFAPTLTIGWGSGGASGLYFGIDAGAMFQGSPRVRELRTTGMLSDPALQEDLQRERAEIEDDIDRFKVYPIVQLALGFRFGGSRAEAPYIAPPPPPAPIAATTQTCADGAVILATDMCAPPPPPPASSPSGSGERG